MISRPRSLLLIYAAVGLYLAAVYFLHYPVPGFFSRARELLTAVLFVWFTASFGRKLAVAFSGPSRHLKVPPELSQDFIWSAVIGISAFALGLLPLGLAGGFSATGLAVLTALFAAWSWREFRYWAVETASGIEKVRRRTLTCSNALIFSLAAALFSLAFLCALAPPTYYDSLVYHLALPAKYLQEGRVGFVPYNHYNHFPQNMELLFGWFLALGNDVSAQLFVLILGLMSGVAVYRLGTTFYSERPARWAAALFMTAPCILFLSIETYVEIPMALWTTMSLWAVLTGLKAAETSVATGEPRQRRADQEPVAWSWFVVSGLMGGFAAGIKYTGVMTPAIIALLLLFRHGTYRARLARAACVAFPSFLVFLPWLLKNFFLTGGNPFFPFLNQWFPAKNVYLHQEAASAYFQVLDEYKGSSSLIHELFQFPWRLMTNPLSFGGGYDVTGDLGWALPLLLVPLFFAYGAKQGHGKFIASYVVLHGLSWACIRPVLRFFIPAFPAICLMAGTGIAGAFAEMPKAARWILQTLVAVFFLSNGVLFYLVERVRDPFPVALGLQTREEYLRRKLDGYSAIEFMGTSLPEDSRILFVGEARGYYCRRPYVAPMPHLPQPLREWSDSAADGPKLRDKLLELGFTHVFFHQREAERLKSYRVLDLTERGQTAWNELLRILPAVYRDPSAAVFALHG